MLIFVQLGHRLCALAAERAVTILHVKMILSTGQDPSLKINSTPQDLNLVLSKQIVSLPQIRFILDG